MEERLDEAEEFHPNYQVASLSRQNHGETGANSHEFGGQLDENEVEWTQECKENQFHEYLAAGVASDLSWLVHALEQEHVDHGRVGNQVNGGNAHENEHGSKLVRVAALVLRLATQPVNSIKQENVSDVMRDLSICTGDSNDEGNHVLLELVLGRNAEDVVLQGLVLLLHHLIDHRGSDLAVAWSAEGAAEAAAAALVFGPVHHVADEWHIHTRLIHELVEGPLVDLVLLVLVEVLGQVLLRMNLSLVLLVQLLDEGPHRLDFFKLEVLIILLVKHQEDVERCVPVRRLVDLRLIEFHEQLLSLLLVVNGHAALVFGGALQGLIARVPADEVGQLRLNIRRGKRAASRRRLRPDVDL